MTTTASASLPVAPSESTPQAATSSYGRIFKSTTLLGGSSLINVGLGIVRTKILAIQLGPALFGLMGLYTSLTGMIQSVASLGIGQSAVRDIAEAAGSQDEMRIARTIRAYRRVVLITGLLGLILTLALALPASWWTFGGFQQASAIAALSVTVLCAEIQAGQNALLQGLRRVKDMAAVNVTGALWSTALAIPVLLLFRERGIVPFLIAVAMGQVVVSWWYARRVKVLAVKVTWRETWEMSRGMLSLGLTFVTTGLSATASVYLIRLILKHYCGEAGVGLYQSAFTISNVYVGFILAAMASDYYPRLAGLGDNVKKRNQLVNEQAEMAVLLAVPGLIAALVLSNLLVWTMYSTRFAEASGILRWQVLGLLGRIISWPMGFILLARADKTAFLWTEIVSNLVVHVCLVWGGTAFFGVAGAGAAFAGLYVFYLIFVYCIVRVRHEYSCQQFAAKMIACGTVAVGLAFATTFIGDVFWRLATGFAVLLGSSIFCIYALAGRIDREGVAGALARLRSRLGLENA